MPAAPARASMTRRSTYRRRSRASPSRPTAATKNWRMHGIPARAVTPGALRSTGTSRQPSRRTPSSAHAPPMMVTAARRGARSAGRKAMPTP